MTKSKLSGGVAAEEIVAPKLQSGEGETGGGGDGGTSSSGGDGSGETGGEGEGEGDGDEETPSVGDGGSGGGDSSGGSASAGGDDREGLSAEFHRYVEKFGVENGPTWFSEGVSWSEAVERQNAILSAENKDLQSKLSAAIAAGGETEPVTFSPEGDKKGGKFQAAGMSDNEARFAAGIKLPAKS